MPRNAPRGTMVHAICQCCGKPFSERRGLPMPKPIAGLDDVPCALRTDGPEFQFDGGDHGDV